MARVVLITPNSAMLERMSPAALRVAMLLPPLGVVQLASYLRWSGHEALVVDAVQERLGPAACARRVADLAPEVIGFSVLTWNVWWVTQAVAALRALGVSAPIVFGNIHAELFRESLLDQGHADYVVLGEGERPLAELARAIQAGTPDAPIPGVVSRTRRTDTGERWFVENLDELPFADWRLIDVDWYLHKTLPFANQPMIPMTVARGCPFHCAFCSQDKLIAHFRHRSVASVLAEMDHNHERLGVNCFAILDGTFPWDEKFGLPLCDALVDSGRAAWARWWCETRVDVMTPRLLHRMKAAGCEHILYGFESGDEAMLQRMNKGITLAQSRQTARDTRAAGIPFHAFFLIGFPGETVGSVLRTIRFALRLRPTTAKFHMALPMPGSALFATVRAALPLDMENPADLKDFDTWNNFALVRGKPVYAPPGMSKRALVALFWLAHLAFYARPWKLISLMTQGYMSRQTLAAAGRVFLENALGHWRRWRSGGAADT